MGYERAAKTRSQKSRASAVPAVPRPLGPLRPAVSPGVSREAPPSVYEALRTPGAPLDAGTRSLMERRFGHSFAHVRVHTEERAAASARAVGALAYTVGRSIVFDRGRYAPHDGAGRSLLAHELVHTLQQSGREPLSDGRPLRVDSPASAGEAEARTIAAASAAPRLSLPSSAPTPAGSVLLQRAPVPTSGGDWDTDNFQAMKDKDVSGDPVPAAQGVRGADITLRFKPNNGVDAELIGLTQSVQSYVAGALALSAAAATRAIPAADAKAINTGKGETDEGTAIDMAAGFNNPIYPVHSAPSASLDDDNTKPSWGQNGWHYTDATKTPKHQDATLTDTPRRPGAQNDSRQIFEVAALATRGVQAGTYYGSVRWGWRTDATGTLTTIPLEKVSDGVPSSTFIKAAGIWDKGKSSTGAANIKLGAPAIYVTIAPVTLNPKAMAMPPLALPVGTRLQIVSGFFLSFLSTLRPTTVKVVDGPNTGVVGEIPPQPTPFLPVLAPERP
jgi:hypothetical protein